MDIIGLLTSAGINIGVCVVLLILYSVLRKQPSYVCVYFTKKFVSEPGKCGDLFCLKRLVPSTSWIIRAWQATDEEILTNAGVDAVVFMRIVVLSIRVFIVAAVICIFLVLPVNYYGQDKPARRIHAESLEAFTIVNVKEGSKWLWTHCLALYVISCSACVLLYFEYKSITKMRLAYITGAPATPSHFTVLVRGIPWYSDLSYSDSVQKFFSNYYPSSYVSHQIVYWGGTVEKIMKDAKAMYRMLKTIEPHFIGSSMPCCVCGGTTLSFKILKNEGESTKGKRSVDSLQQTQRGKERPAAFVFFRTRYAAVVAAQLLQSPNPTLWVTQLAPEPHDVYWRNLSIPYKQIWLRKIATLICAIAFTFLFLIPVSLVQSLTQLYTLSLLFPFLRGILQKKYVSKVVTGYLPSAIMVVFQYAAPPVMMLFSTIEGNVSRSERKKSACLKVLYFTIWNIFFANVLSGKVISAVAYFSNIRVSDMPLELAKLVPAQVTFFTTYVLSSGWASLACELMQPFALFTIVFRRFVLRTVEVPSAWVLSFPYHTEIPRLLLFVLVGFNFSVLAPMILPFVLIYFCFAFIVYRNQILHVYMTKYESGGQFWPIVHNTTVFSLILTQVIALGVFVIKQSPVAAGFTVPLIIITLLFNQYCRQRFAPVFSKSPVQILIEMDRQDEKLGKIEEIFSQLHSAYSLLPPASEDPSTAGSSRRSEDHANSADLESMKPGNQLAKSDK